MLTLILKDIKDPIVRENFFRISNFISQNVLIGTDFKFYEVDIPQKNYAYPIPHGLKFTPTDIIPLASEGDFNYYFRTDESDSTNIYVAADGPVRLRFLAGCINQTGRRPLSDSQLPFVSPTADTTGTISSSGSDGWVFIQDGTYTSSNPLIVSANARTLLPNDKTGSLTNYTQAPSNASSWWSASTATFSPSKLGEFYTFKLNFIVVPTVANKNILFETDIGTTNATSAQNIYMSRGAGATVKVSQSIPFSVGSSTFQNGVRLYVTPDCQCSIYNINLTIIRDFHL